MNNETAEWQSIAVNQIDKLVEKINALEQTIDFLERETENWRELTSCDTPTAYEMMQRGKDD